MTNEPPARRMRGLSRRGLPRQLQAALAAALLLAAPAAAADISVLERRSVQGLHSQAATLELRLALAVLEGSGWTQEAALDATRGAARILAQCGIAVRQIEIVRVAAPGRYHYFSTPVSRELARALPLSRPTVYFVTDTRQYPAFDAEAIGRGNSRTRPELADTVWITRGARDPAIVLAHELVHVLMNSGEHVETPGNLMRAETAPEATALDEAQCARLRATGAAHELLRPAGG